MKDEVKRSLGVSGTLFALEFLSSLLKLKSTLLYLVVSFLVLMSTSVVHDRISSGRNEDNRYGRWFERGAVLAFFTMASTLGLLYVLNVSLGNKHPAVQGIITGALYALVYPLARFATNGIAR